jgi:hypothetical protein
VGVYASQATVQRWLTACGLEADKHALQTLDGSCLVFLHLTEVVTP